MSPLAIRNLASPIGLESARASVTSISRSAQTRRLKAGLMTNLWSKIFSRQQDKQCRSQLQTQLTNNKTNCSSAVTYALAIQTIRKPNQHTTRNICTQRVNPSNIHMLRSHQGDHKINSEYEGWWCLNLRNMQVLKVEHSYHAVREPVLTSIMKKLGRKSFVHKTLPLTTIGHGPCVAQECQKPYYNTASSLSRYCHSSYRDCTWSIVFYFISQHQWHCKQHRRQHETHVPSNHWWAYSLHLGAGGPGQKAQGKMRSRCV